MAHRDDILDASCMAGLGAVGLWLRLSTLKSRFVNIDDLFQLYAVTRPAFGAFLNALPKPNQALLEISLEFLLARLTTSLNVLRLLPVLWGAAAVPTAYALGRRLRGRTLGLIWGFLLAVSVVHIQYSQTLRPYALASWLSLVSFYYFFDALEGKAPWKYALTLGLLQAVYPHAVFLGLTQWLWVAWRRPALARRMLWSLAPCGAVFAAWSLLGGTRTFLSPTDQIFSVAILSGVVSAFSQASPAAVVAYAAAFFAGVAACVAGVEREKLSLAIVCLAGSFAAMLASHYYFRYMFYPRHAIALLPVYLGVAASGFTILVETSAARLPMAPGPARAACLGLLFFGILELSLPAFSDYLRGENVQTAVLRDSVDFVKARLGPDDAVILGNPNTGATFLYGLDQSVFRALAGESMRSGFGLFQFPADLAIRRDRSRVPVFTLCRFFPAMATLDDRGYRQLKARVRAAGGKVWFVSMMNLNYFDEASPFYASLGIPRDGLIEAFPGIFLDRPLGGR